MTHCGGWRSALALYLSIARETALALSNAIQTAKKSVPKENSFVVKSASCLGHVNDLANGNHEKISVNALGEQLARSTYAIDLAKATGGPCIYTGQDMKTARTGLHITDADWNASAAHLTETLNKFKVPQKEQGEVMVAISGLKGQIVGQ